MICSNTILNIVTCSKRNIPVLVTGLLSAQHSSLVPAIALIVLEVPTAAHLFFAIPRVAHLPASA